MDGINFTYYPDSNRVPGVFVEMDPSQANTATILQATLIIGQRHGGDGNPNVAIEVQSLEQVQELAGIDSMLANMVQNYQSADPFADLWIMIMDDDPAAQPAAGGIMITGVATESGTLCVYVAGMLVAVPVNVNDDAARVAGNFIVAARANIFLPAPSPAMFNRANST
jgi:phage tail sheath gpL-like